MVQLWFKLWFFPSIFKKCFLLVFTFVPVWFQLSIERYNAIDIIMFLPYSVFPCNLCIFIFMFFLRKKVILYSFYNIKLFYGFIFFLCLYNWKSFVEIFTRRNHISFLCCIHRNSGCWLKIVLFVSNNNYYILSIKNFFLFI